MEKKASELKAGEEGVISTIREGAAMLKLMEMGCLPGERIKVEHIAPFGDPIAFKIAGTILSIRKEEAAIISVLN